MMSSKTREELNQLLQQATPDELMAQLGDSLDDDGRAYLAQRKQQPEIEDVLRDSGRTTRRLLDNPPEFRLPDDFKWDDEPEIPVLRPKFGGRLLGFLSVAAAVVLAAFLGYQQKQTIIFDSKGQIIFERSVGQPGAQELDHALFEALKKRGMFFLKAAQANGSIAYYEEAYKDLGQAHALHQDDEILDALRIIQPILQQNYEKQQPE